MTISIPKRIIAALLLLFYSLEEKSHTSLQPLQNVCVITLQLAVSATVLPHSALIDLG